MRSPLPGTLFGRLGNRRVALVVWGGAFLSVTAVYVVVVLGGGLLIGHTDSPHMGLSILATAIVALGLEPLRSWLEGVAKRWVPGDRATPYDVLSRFTDSLTGDLESGRVELPLRMARLLAEGTGARWAEVWLVVDGEPELAAGWPEEAGSRQDGADGDQPGPRSLDVTLDGVRLGVLRLQERSDQPLSPVEERLFAGLAAQAGLVLRGAAAPRRPGEAGRGPGDPGRGPPGRRADVSSTPMTPSGGAWSATSTTGPSNTWSRSWSTSASPTP